MRTVLIDADTLIYQVGIRVETPIRWDHGNAAVWTLHAHEGRAISLLDDLIHEIVESLEGDEAVVVLSDYDHPAWREEIYPTYKDHRDDTRRPLVWAALRRHLQEEYRCYVKPGLEGDDVLGILMTHPKIIPGEKVCVSIDKDLKTIPGLHCNYRKGFRNHDSLTDAIVKVSEEVADLNHLYQTLMGDKVDGYPGAPGWGKVRAKRLLKEGLVLEPREHTFSRGERKGETETRWEPGEPGTPWEIVVSAYKSSGLNEAEALRNAQVARICRASDYDFENKEVIPWQPPTDP